MESQHNDVAVRGISANGNLRILACTTTAVVNEIQRRHDTWPTATAAIGRTVSVAAMMAMMLKEQEKVTLQVRGDGPLGSITVDADSEGNVRGYAQNPHVHLPANARGKLDVGGAVGQGVLYVLRDTGLKDFYRGSSELQSGEIGDDFTYYFAVSEQVLSSVGVGVLVDVDNTVIVSGGFIVQLMPGYTDEDVRALEQKLASIPSVTELLHTGMSAEDLLCTVVPDGHLLEERPIQFACTCSRERVARTLKGLGESEIRSMIDEQGSAEAVCHFCNEAYVFSKSELEDLMS